MAEEQIIRAKWAMDGATTLEEAAGKLEAHAARLRGMAEEGWRLEGAVEDDYGTVVQEAGSPT